MKHLTILFPLLSLFFISNIHGKPYNSIIENTESIHDVFENVINEISGKQIKIETNLEEVSSINVISEAFLIDKKNNLNQVSNWEVFYTEDKALKEYPQLISNSNYDIFYLSQTDLFYIYLSQYKLNDKIYTADGLFLINKFGFKTMFVCIEDDIIETKNDSLSISQDFNLSDFYSIYSFNDTLKAMNKISLSKNKIITFSDVKDCKTEIMQIFSNIDELTLEDITYNQFMAWMFDEIYLNKAEKFLKVAVYPSFNCDNRPIWAYYKRGYDYCSE